MKASTIFATLLTSALFFAQKATSHTWVDQLNVVGGPFMPSNLKPGYIRNYQGREVPNVDVEETYRLNQGDMHRNICTQDQQQPGQAPNFPYLTAYPGSLVEAQYTENGHISRRRLKLDGTGNFNDSGTIYWYASFKPNPARTITDVQEWTRDGTGGNKEGMLLSTSDYDDGMCIEAGHPEPIFKDRKVGPCASQFRIPKDAKVGQLQEFIMLWDYSCHFQSEGFKEFYSSCMDIMVADPKAASAAPPSAPADGKGSYGNPSPPPPSNPTTMMTSAAPSYQTPPPNPGGIPVYQPGVPKVPDDKDVQHGGRTNNRHHGHGGSRQNTNNDQPNGSNSNGHGNGRGGHNHQNGPGGGNGVGPSGFYKGGSASLAAKHPTIDNNGKLISAKFRRELKGDIKFDV